HLEDAARSLDRVAFPEMLVLTEHDRAHRVLLEIKRETEGVARKLEHLTVARVGKSMDAHDAVGNGNDRADVARLGDGFEVLDALLDEIADLGRLDGHLSTSSLNVCAARSCRERVSHALQSSAHRAIDHQIARTHDRTADELWIDVTLE